MEGAITLCRGEMNGCYITTRLKFNEGQENSLLNLSIHDREQLLDCMSAKDHHHQSNEVVAVKEKISSPR